MAQEADVLTTAEEIVNRLELAAQAMNTLISEATECNHGPEIERLMHKREGIWASLTIARDVQLRAEMGIVE